MQTNILTSTNLEQTPTFGPFVRKLVSLFQIAGRASYHDIAYIICSSTRKRDNVFDMICRQFFATIVALTLLPCVLLVYLVYCIGALRCSLDGTTLVLTCTSLFACFWSLAIFFAAGLLALAYLWSVPIVYPINAPLFLHFRAAFVDTKTFLLFWTVMIGTKTRLYLRTTLILFRIGLCILLYFRTATICFEVGILALFALLVETIFFLLIPVKKLSGSGELSTTFSTLFSWSIIRGYNDTHDRSPKSVITPGLFAVAPGSTLLPPQYTTKPLHKQLQGVFA